jgi:nitroimidazol reductase NimA-like FMN-containing flavoprotein (pyridoxamine 5'-phosphate oxidase superfamily)
MARTSKPRFTELSRADSAALLERNHVGRLAFSFHDKVDIEPISYVFNGEWIIARTSHGTKLTTMQHHPWVAFEVDEVESVYDWQSVVVHGSMSMLDPGGSDRDREAYTAAIDSLRELDASVLTAGDAAPHRTAVFRIHADEVIGRAASSAP